MLNCVFCRLKSCASSGLCKPNCIAAAFAIDINMKDGSVHIEDVGKGHVHISRMAFTRHALCGNVEIWVQSIFMKGGPRDEIKVGAASYRRAETLMIA